MRSIIVTLASLPVLLLACPPSSDCEILLTCGPADEGAGGTSASTGGAGGSQGGSAPTCSDPRDCGGGACVDGFCCDGPCLGPCEACNVAGVEGTCTQHGAGTDPDDECTGGTCDGVGQCAVGNHLWSERYGDAQDQLVLGLARDAMGNMLVSGGFFGTLDMGNGALVAGSSDLFVAKIAANGNTTWSLKFGDDQPNGFTRVAATTQGGVYLAATFLNTANFGGGILSSNGGFPLGDVALAKLQANGAHSWSDAYGDSSPQSVNGVAVDSQDNVIVVGQYRGTLDFGQPLVNANTFDEPYVAKLSGSGSYLWATRFGAIDAFEATRAVAVAPDDSIVMCGEFDDTISFGSGQLTAMSTRDIFVAKLDEDGNHLWSQRFGTTGSQGCSSVAVDARGRVAITGHVDGAVDFGGGSLPAGGLGDAFVAVFDAVGNHLWSRRFGDAEEQGGTSLAFDPGGNLVLSGSFAGEVDFGAGAVPSAGGKDAFIIKLSPEGVLLWSKRLGDTLDQNALQVVCGSDSTIAVAGTLTGTVDLGGGALVGSGLDVVVGLLGP